jgi:diguanylate cyclase (GGDEF)-like protein
MRRTYSDDPTPDNASFLQQLKALQEVVVELRRELQAVKDREMCARHLALHDDLTRLPNRRFFRDRLSRALQTDHPVLAVIYVDLDGFKALNDNHGHAIGDHLLTLVASRLVHSLRAEDLVSRLGGDEFACLLTGISNRERLQEISATLQGAVAAPLLLDAHSHPLTVRPSIGIAVCPDDGLTVESLMKAADVDMYAMKRARISTSQLVNPITSPVADLE